MKFLMGKPLFFLLAIASVIFLQMGSVFILLALLPTLVAYYIDREQDRPVFKIVGACNLAATLPYIAPMVRTSMHLKHYDAWFLMGDPAAWMFIYSGAAAGWCLIFLCRVVARLIVSIFYQYNIMALERVQAELVREWGKQIIQPPSLGTLQG